MTDPNFLPRKSALDADIEAYRSLLERLSHAGRPRFVGNPPLPPLPRDGEIEDRGELRDLLKQIKAGDDSVLLVGPGGVGKTALVHALIRTLELEPSGLAGVVYLSSRDNLTFERLYMSVAELIGGDTEASMVARWNDRKVSVEQKSRGLIRQLLLDQRRTYLLVLDLLSVTDSNNDVFSEDMQTFFQVLSKTPGRGRLKLLLTSRTPIDSKYAVALFPLWGGLTEEAGVSFLKRHIGVEADLAADLVKLVAGAPRGLELITSNVKQGMMPAEVLSLLRGDAGDDLEARMSILARTNYDQLDTVAAYVLRILAVFGEAVPRAAIACVLEALGKDTRISTVLKRLVALRTVHVEKLGDDKATIKLYSIHEIDAQIAIPGSAELSELHRLAGIFYGRVRGSPPFASMRDVTMQMLEFRHLLKAGETLDALAVLDSLDYSPRSHHKYLASLVALGRGSFAADRRSEVAAQLEPPDGSAHRSDRTLLAAGAANLTSRAWVQRRLNKKAEAREGYENALALAEAAQDDAATIYARSEFGYFLTDNANQHDHARELLTSALQLANERGNAYEQGHCTLGLAFVDFQQGDAKSCERHADNALKFFHTDNSRSAPYREVDCLVRLSMLYRKEGRISDAESRTLQATEIAERHHLYGWPGELQSQLGFHRRALAQYEAAISHHRAALDLMLDLRREAAVQHSYIANLETEIGIFGSARVSFDDALDIATRIEVSRECSWILANRGVLSCKLGDYDDAIKDQEQSLDIILKNEHKDSEVIRRTDLAETYLIMGVPDAATEALCFAVGVKVEADLSKLTEAFLKLDPKKQTDDLPHEMQMPGNFARQGIILARLLLRRNLHAEATKVLRATSLGPEAIGRRPRLLLLEAIASTQAGYIEVATSLFEAARAAADAVLRESPNSYDAAYSKGVALSGLALARAQDDRDRRIGSAQMAIRQATELCGASGVKQDNNALLSLLRSADNEGVLADLQIYVSPSGN